MCPSQILDPLLHYTLRQGAKPLSKGAVTACDHVPILAAFKPRLIDRDSTPLTQSPGGGQGASQIYMAPYQMTTYTVLVEKKGKKIMHTFDV